jgi:DNA-binding Xre family transcriptional regulator
MATYYYPISDAALSQIYKQARQARLGGQTVTASDLSKAMDAEVASEASLANRRYAEAKANEQYEKQLAQEKELAEATLAQTSSLSAQTIAQQKALAEAELAQQKGLSEAELAQQKSLSQQQIDLAKQQAANAADSSMLSTLISAPLSAYSGYKLLTDPGESGTSIIGTVKNWLGGGPDGTSVIDLPVFQTGEAAEAAVSSSVFDLPVFQTGETAMSGAATGAALPTLATVGAGVGAALAADQLLNEGRVTDRRTRGMR